MKNVFESLAKKFTKTASVEVKKEVRKTAVDLIPGILAFVGTVVAIIVFHEASSSNDDMDCLSRTTTSITTNNYFFQDLSDEMIQKIIDDK